LELRETVPLIHLVASIKVALSIPYFTLSGSKFPVTYNTFPYNFRLALAGLALGARGAGWMRSGWFS
jgi:hypothetical protein